MGESPCHFTMLCSCSHIRMRYWYCMKETKGVTFFSTIPNIGGTLSLKKERSKLKFTRQTLVRDGWNNLCTQKQQKWEDKWLWQMSKCNFFEMWKNFLGEKNKRRSSTSLVRFFPPALHFFFGASSSSLYHTWFILYHLVHTRILYIGSWITPLFHNPFQSTYRVTLSELRDQYGFTYYTTPLIHWHLSFFFRVC